MTITSFAETPRKEPQFGDQDISEDPFATYGGVMPQMEFQAQDGDDYT